MTREEKIKYAMAFLAPLLFEKEFQGPSEPVQITFHSSLGAEIKIGGGEPQKVEFGLPFRLQDAIRNFVDYSIDTEYDDWQCYVDEQYEKDELEEDGEGGIKYDPELVTNHIYHSIHFCQELIEDYFS